MQTRYISTVAAALLLVAVPGMGQTFTSGSTGADGALTYAANLGIVVFDPVLAGIDADGDNVFHFTTINIGVGTTLRLFSNRMRNAAAGVVFLATGDVRIAGTIDASAQIPAALNTNNAAQFLVNRFTGMPGPGGYPGGVGSKDSVAPQSGGGPGGGPAGAVGADYSCYGGYAAHQTVASTPGYPPYSLVPRSAVTYGNLNLIPMYGGSGGGGGWGSTAAQIGGTGGAGGGAIRIVSTTKIDVAGGAINAIGVAGSTVTGTSAGCPGGIGSGGSVHLIAPLVPSIGTIDASGSYAAVAGAALYGGNGYVRVNTGATPAGSSNPPVVVGPLFNPPLPNLTPIPSLRIVSVNNVPAPVNPQLSYLAPDVQINANTPVQVAISAVNVPVGTVVKLRLSSEFGGDQSVDCIPLAGTATASTASCTATYPFSVSVSNIRASW